MADKIIKDSIHGYIAVDRFFIRIVDSAEFQRLKDIEQGSFRVLFPAARHDRFIHSLGVYHLACLFADNFIKNLNEDFGTLDIESKKLEKVKKTFRYAALLHDIGHAPFSHTTEKFFLNKQDETGERASLQVQFLKEMKTCLEEENDYTRFCEEYNTISTKPAPHEIMSATVLMRKAKKFLGDEIDDIDLPLAVRMVIGCTFNYEYDKKATENEKYTIGIKNCFIRLLNSGTVDVDKLDYIKRDTEMSGFANVVVDIERLARSVTAIKKSGWLYPAFRKNALSVIDNVFRAKSEQGLWMVSHPVVIYHSELLSFCIMKLQDLIGDNYIEKVFSLDGLDVEGVKVKEKVYRLISDIDIGADLKQHMKDDVSFAELYDRNQRHSPVWKSYYEFKYIFDIDEKGGLEQVCDFFDGLIKFMRTSNIFFLNDDTMKKIMEDDDDKIISKAKFLEQFCEEEKIPFDFVLLQAINSFSPKISNKEIFILFNRNLGKEANYVTYKFLKNGESIEDKRKMFYLYTRKKFSDQNLIHFREKLFEKIGHDNILKV